MSARANRSRRWIAMVVVLAFWAAGCANSGGSANGPITVLVWGSPDEISAYRTLATAYEDSHPGISVSLIEAANRDDLLARLSTGFASGNPPDLFLVNYRFFGQYAARGVIEPLDERVERSTAFTESDFFPAAIEAFQYEGQQLCLPQNVASLVVYYNQDLFEAAGVALPEAGWTWDDMIAAASQLTVDLDGDSLPDQFGLGLDPEFIRVAPFIWSNGGEIVDDPSSPSRMDLSSPEALEVLQDFLDLYFTDGVVPSELDFESEDNESRFAGGRMAMVLSSRRSTPFLRTITDFVWDVAPLPIYDLPVTILHSDAYCLSAQSRRTDAAWSFMEWAVGPEGAPVIAATGRTVPSLRSVAESPAFLDETQPPANAQVFLDAVETIRSVPTLSTWPEIEDESALILEIALWREPQEAAAVAADIEAATEPLFDRAER